jgi:hypothetical protein
VRAGPSSRFEIRGTLPPGAGGIEMMGRCVRSWCPIRSGDIDGWVNGKFLEAETADAAPAAPDSTAEAPAQPAGGAITFLPDGSMEIQLPDGNKRRQLPGGRIVKVRPDGSIVGGNYRVNAQGPNLPALPPEYDVFGTKVNNELLKIIKNILSADEFAQYEQTEAGKSMYDLASWRLLSIEFLTGPRS